MKTTKQRKGKAVDNPKRQNTVVGSVGVKKSTNKIGGRQQRTTVGCQSTLVKDDPGVLHCSAAQVVGQQLPRSYTLAQQTTKEISKLEPKTGLYSSEKIKLQLFPIDEATRIELEKDGHIPFLELTLSVRKKISSVLKHLNSKWGSSSVAMGDPMLFPYNIQLEKLSTYKQWTLNDIGISAGDVYAAVECPSVFRLRYGWFSELRPKTVAVPSRSTHLGDGFETEEKGCSTISELADIRKEEVLDFKPTNLSKPADAAVTMNMHSDVPVDYMDDEVNSGNSVAPSLVPWDDSLTNLSIGGLLSDTSLLGKIGNCDPKSEGSKLHMQPIQLISSDISIGGLLSEASMQGKFNDHQSKSNGSKLGMEPILDKDLVQSAVPWDDSLTNLSIGGLFSGASLLGKMDSCNLKSNGGKLGFHPTPLISDSLDAFIAGEINSQPQDPKPPSYASCSSILDAEETCHAFPFRKLSSSGNNAVRVIGSAISRDHIHDGSSKSFEFSKLSELNAQRELAHVPPPRQESKTVPLTHLGVNNDESSLGLAGINWTESLGPFEFSLPSSRHITSADNVGISKLFR
ncbi:TSL-kinase interacting protein 1 [Rhododendron vialii]|uniref:TSL-kinase interacting protein 1 n=1 Tax=Rhododendron vialii TaxID=182163 RepID=UPI00265FBB04|nr:TSL-kinase interacting protein 1 [Rhododendron vialii]